MFNHLAKEAGLKWEADSCGLNIAALGPEHPGTISRWAMEALTARGIQAGASRKPRQVCQADLAGADLVVALKEAEHRQLLEKLHPEWAERVRYWHVHDLDAALSAEAMAELEGLVKNLVEQLKTGGRS